MPWYMAKKKITLLLLSSKVIFLNNFWNIWFHESFVVADDNCVKDSSELEVPSPEVIELTSGEESSIVNVVETTTISRTYRCRKCGAPKTRGGHGCPAADQSSSEVTTPSPPGQQLRRVPRKASNSGNLTRLAQRYVEENAEESGMLIALQNCCTSVDNFDYSLF